MVHVPPLFDALHQTVAAKKRHSIDTRPPAGYLTRLQSLLPLPSMRFPLSLFCSSLLAGLVFCRPVEYPRTAARDIRDLLGLLGENANVPPNTITPTATSIQTITPTTTVTNGEPHIPPTHVRTAVASTLMGSTSAPGITTPLTLTLSPTSTSASISASSVYPSPETSTPSSSTAFAPGVLEDASTTPPAELKQWKVIGIAVITITFIAIVALAVSFFDSWWGFVRAAICGKRAKSGHGGETMIPDWEKRSWEFQLANEDGHRYPTLASLESIVKEKEKAQTLGVEGRGAVVSADIAYGW